MVAERVKGISTSLIRRMFEVVERAKKEGKEVINLSIGEPDFKTPEEVIEKAYEYMKRGYTHYTSNFGIDELRYAIADRYKVDYDWVMVTTGGSEALLNASLAFIERGSDVVIPSPNFLSYFAYAKLCEANVVEIKTHPNFEIDLDRLNEVITNKTSVIFLNYPNNPTGVVLDEKTLRGVLEIAEEKGVLVISDEIYDRIYYDKKPVSLAGNENVVVVNGFSKSLAMTGWRIGFVIAHPDFLNEMLKVHQVNGVCAPSFAQKAIADVLNDGSADRFIDKMVREFRRRRDFVYSKLRRIFEVVKPEGAFYIFPNVGVDCEDFCERLLIEKGVCLTPGKAFGSGNEIYVRISFANSMENLKIAMERIEEYVCEGA